MASVLDIAMAVVDGVMAVIPRRRPGRAALERARLISHRGEHNNKDIIENTLDAFEAAHAAGVWGIECDIRWTKDLVPVICHDPTPQRLFGIHTPLAETSFEELRKRVPAIPSLEDVVREYGGKMHLMLEIKAGHWPNPARQSDTLRDILAGLAPGDNFHLLSLEPQLFSYIAFADERYCLPVAETNVAAISNYALDNGCAGIGGHYLLLGNHLARRHAAVGQRLGTGFPASRNCLYRELNRGIEWVFSNDAAALQATLKNALSAGNA